MMRDAGREQKGQLVVISGRMEEVSFHFGSQCRWFAGSQRPRWEPRHGSSALRQRDEKPVFSIQCPKRSMGTANVQHMKMA